MKNLKLFAAGTIAAWMSLVPSLVSAQRHSVNISNWLFSRDSTSWSPVTVPHDWAISGPFDKKWDMQRVRIVQNGEKEATEKTGRSGALPWIGRGFYKTEIDVPADCNFAELVFDGAMSEPHVYVNGRLAGYWAYGYNAFRVNIKPYLKAGHNEVAVSLNNKEESSRWYPGGGIYRPVILQYGTSNQSKAYFDDWGTFVQTTSIYGARDGQAERAALRISAQLLQATQGQGVKVAVKAADGSVVYTKDCRVDATGKVDMVCELNHPTLWSPENPYLYTLSLSTSGDEMTTRFGVRTVSVSAEHGFQLNGVSRKIKGVCLHHDLGPLGAAVNKAALIRQVRILKDMGCDAIRTSHNMPSAMQLEVYDSLGMMVMAESFDMWIYPKCKNGYARFFNDWADRDITNLVLHHRNHPSVVMWSIGNEIPEQWSEEGVRWALHLQDLCHQLDPSRPVTQGCDRVDNALNSGFLEAMDIPGLNYRVHKYNSAYQKLSKGFLLGSETASTISSRGVYKFPVRVTNSVNYDDGQVSGYDTEYCSWSNLPETDFMMQDDKPWTIGQFVWTGFDYLGEPTPYDEYWPSRSSYFGICDLAGLPKDRFYLYRSQWNQQAHTLHLLPHWTWPGREGQVTPVYCYTDYPEAELFVNGKSQGRIRKNLSKHANDVADKDVNTQPLLDRYRLRWNDVVYQPGEIKVVAYDAQGIKASEQVVRTAGKAKAIKLECDRPVLGQEQDNCLKADGQDLAYITVSLVDKAGTTLPTATDDIQVEVSGAGTFRGICNGDATSLEVFTQPHMHLFAGYLVVTVQAGIRPGNMKVVVRDRTTGLKKQIVIPVQ